MDIFSKNLKKLRQERGVSIKEMAKVAKVCPSTIYNWEKGKVMPLMSHVVRIAVFFKISLANLTEHRL